MEARDRLGQPLNVGDYVVWALGTRTSYLNIGKILEMEERTVNGWPGIRRNILIRLAELNEDPNWSYQNAGGAPYRISRTRFDADEAYRRDPLTNQYVDQGYAAFTRMLKLDPATLMHLQGFPELSSY